MGKKGLAMKEIEVSDLVWFAIKVIQETQTEIGRAEIFVSDLIKYERAVINKIRGSKDYLLFTTRQDWNEFLNTYSYVFHLRANTDKGEYIIAEGKEFMLDLFMKDYYINVDKEMFDLLQETAKSTFQVKQKSA